MALTYLRGNDSRLAEGKKRSALFFFAAAHRCTRKCTFLKAEVLKQPPVRDKSISVIIFQSVQRKMNKRMIKKKNDFRHRGRMRGGFIYLFSFPFVFIFLFFVLKVSVSVLFQLGFKILLPYHS